MKFSQVALAALIGLAAATPVRAAENLEFDPAHTSVNFKVRHMMVSNVRGKFTTFHGTLFYDDKDVTRSKVSGTIDTGSITTDNARRDKHLKSADFFDVEKYPQITFHSTKIEKHGQDFVAIGPLTLRGVTREVRIPFTIIGKMVDKTGKIRLGVEAGLSLNRHDYGVSWNKTLDSGGVVVGEKVEIELAGEVVSPEK